MSPVEDRIFLRIQILAVVITICMSVLFGRLWFLQAVAGENYRRMAEENRRRELPVAAPRGTIYDRHRAPLVANRMAISLTLIPSERDNKDLIERLAIALGMTPADIERQIRSPKIDPILPRVIKRDLEPKMVAYIEENQASFPGVELKEEAVRSYANGPLGAHALGYVGEVSEEELKMPEFKQNRQGDLVGKSGVERTHGNLLSGARGLEIMEVDATGRALRLLSRKEPEPGNNLILTLDRNIQASTEAALADGIKAARKGEKKVPAVAGAAVVLSPENGEILALASYPSFDPQVFLGGVSTEQWQALTHKNSHYPLNNRAIMSSYPPGSTFKVVTAAAGLAAGVVTPGTPVVCRGRWTGFGDRWSKWCWNKAGHGPVSLEAAMAVSCDSYFYEVGYRLYRRGNDELQAWSRRMGLGSLTGVDLPSETGGRVPDAAWKKAWNKNWPENQPWFPGDTVNMSIGQGDMLVSPLQLANVYAAIANGGTLYQPHVVKEVLSTDEKTSVKVPAKARGGLGVNPTHLAAIKRGLRRVVTDGTASGVFSGFPVPLAGKTGTSEVIGKEDTAFFVTYAPFNDPRYVVAVVVEEGGHGGSTSAPIARKILSDIYGVPYSLQTGEDASR